MIQISFAEKCLISDKIFHNSSDIYRVLTVETVCSDLSVAALRQRPRSKVCVSSDYAIWACKSSMFSHLCDAIVQKFIDNTAWKEMLSMHIISSPNIRSKANNIQRLDQNNSLNGVTHISWVRGRDENVCIFRTYL